MKRFNFETDGEDEFDDDHNEYDDDNDENESNNFLDSQMLAIQMEQNFLLEQEIQTKLLEESIKICSTSWFWSFTSLKSKIIKIKNAFEEIKKMIQD